MEKPQFGNRRRLEETDILKVSSWAAKRGEQFPAYGGRSTKSELLEARNSLRRMVNVASDEARAAHNKPGPESIAAVDEALEMVELLGVLVHDVQTTLNQKDMAESFGRSASDQAWKSATGQAVRALKRGDRMTDETMSPPPGFGFGEFISAAVNGTQNPAVRNALSEGSDSAGGFTVPTYLTQTLIDAMRDRTVAIQAGAMTLPLSGAQTTIARVVADPQAGWRLENDAVIEGQPTFGAVVLKPKSLAVLVKVSRELMQDSLNLEQALLQAFAGSMAVEADRAALFGAGANGVPLGLYGTVGINEVSMGVNGGPLTGFDPLLDALMELETANASAPTSMILHPRTRRAISGFKDSTGQPLRPPQALENLPAQATTIVPVNQVQGTATNASCILMGDFSQMIFGIRQELRIEVLRETFATNLQYAFLAHLRMDVAIAQPAAFAVVKGITP